MKAIGVAFKFSRWDHCPMGTTREKTKLFKALSHKPQYLDRQIAISTAFDALLVLDAYASSYVVFHCIRLGSLIVFAVFWRAIWQGDYRIDTRPRGIDGR
jgi:hypothetical protein